MLATQKPASSQNFANKIKMQHQLFAALSGMFGGEVPLYDKSLLVNRVCNQTVCAQLSQMHDGFTLTDKQLDKTSGERHGAIRIGTPEEYRWVAGFFAAFNLLPHNFYDMTTLGSKSQPIIATAFRSPVNPEHRVFCSLLMVDNFDPEIRRRVEDLLAKRQVFSERAKELILKNEEQGGLDDAEAKELINEGTERIFKWTGQAHDFQLYKDLCAAGFKIAADISCFESHHLNHLTPNTFCMDLYTTAMKYCLGEFDQATFEKRAFDALAWLRSVGDAHYMKLHFRHLTGKDIEAFSFRQISDETLQKFVNTLSARLRESDLDLSKLNHSGFKDFTEGPPADTPVLLRQDSYKALTEPVTFHEPDGSTVDSEHTARFGEIEQRFYATTAAGRTLYDNCLADANAARDANPGLVKSDFEAYLKSYSDAFAAYPEALPELLKKKLVFGRYSATDKGREAAPPDTTNIQELIALGLVRYEGLRYEDFLPFSAAGIFASNLGQYGTKSTATEKPTYTQATLETIMKRPIIDPNVVYSGMEAESLIRTYKELGILEKLAPADVTELEAAVAASNAVLAEFQ